MPVDDHTGAIFYKLMQQQGQIIERLTPWPHLSLIGPHASN
jgi:hypothetical protein